MTIPTNIFTYAQWSGIFTIICFIATIAAFIFGWNFRFRLVGVTAFTTLLTVGIFTLGLSLFPHTEIPGAVRYTLVYDNGSNLAVIAVPPEIEKSAIEPTLRQAAEDLYSYGRTPTNGNDRFLIKIRTIMHPDSGVSLPLYLGAAERSLVVRNDDNIQIETFDRNIAQLPETSGNLE
ncbi:DUF2518 family protein [Myxosarcina sp. GI1(2024)]